jgi:hypothetical protein
MDKTKTFRKPHEDFVYCEGVDENDNPVQKTKSEYPYSYDGFITWRCGENEEGGSTLYSDRLLRQNYEKCRAMMQKHFGKQSDYWSEYIPEQIELFLRDWCNAPNLKLIYIMEYCNVSNGYPYWRFDFNANKKNEYEK